MIEPSPIYKRLTLVAGASLALAAGCGNDSPEELPPPPDGGVVLPNPDAPPPPPPPLTPGKRASRSSAIAISDDDKLVAMVNPDDGSLSVFDTSNNNERLSRTPTGNNPSSVVIAGDGKTAFVANRNDATVTRVVNIDSGRPMADAALGVGSEPVGLALSPTGKRLFVAEFAESRVSVIDTQSFSIITTIQVDRPRALVVTNNLNETDDDETLLVSQFFGTPVAGGEVKDNGRTGVIATFPLSALESGRTDITLAPTATGVLNATTSPNQLAAMAVAGSRVYITSVSASPEGPPAFNRNVFPVVYVADIATRTEVKDGSGTANLTPKVIANFPNPTADAPRFQPGDLSDIAFLDDSQVAYVVAKAGDLMLRLAYDSELDVGADINPQIDLIGNAAIGSCQAPIGVVVSKSLGRGFVNCWVTRRLGVVNFADQTLIQTVESTALPPAGSIEESVRKGKRFFFTGRARWSNDGAVAGQANSGNGAKGGEGWSSCGSCHPDGLTDNITWAFPAGPRQTTSMDGSFSHGPGGGAQKQRIFNWTSVNDEMHDFEINTRNVSGGKGAITSGDCSAVNLETAVTIVPMGQSAKFLADSQVAPCKRSDWDDINNYVKTIVPPRAPKAGDPASIERGRRLFGDGQGNCNQCHSGAGWTVSRRPYNPLGTSNGDGATSFAGGAFAQNVFNRPLIYDDQNQVRTQISVQPLIGADGLGPETAEVAVLQLACSLRNVGTYGRLRDANFAIEVRAAGPAQGRAGYNVPALYGLTLGAPFLHHGQAPTLEDLFTNPNWASHTNAGNTNFSLTLNTPGNLADLINFLKSIDASAQEFTIPTKGTDSFDVCPEPL